MIKDPAAATALLFSYGTLQDRAVQLANFQRELSGSSDSLPGYSTTLIVISEPGVVETSGKTQHKIVLPTGGPRTKCPVPFSRSLLTSWPLRIAMRSRSTGVCK
jgi:hypothetical protein